MTNCSHTKTLMGGSLEVWLEVGKQTFFIISAYQRSMFYMYSLAEISLSPAKNKEHHINVVFIGSRYKRRN